MREGGDSEIGISDGVGGAAGEGRAGEDGGGGVTAVDRGCTVQSAGDGELGGSQIHAAAVLDGICKSNYLTSLRVGERIGGDGQGQQFGDFIDRDARSL